MREPSQPKTTKKDPIAGISLGKRHGASRPVSGVVVGSGDARNDNGGRVPVGEPEGLHRGAPEGLRPSAFGAGNPVFPESLTGSTSANYLQMEFF